MILLASDPSDNLLALLAEQAAPIDALEVGPYFSLGKEQLRENLERLHAILQGPSLFLRTRFPVI